MNNPFDRLDRLQRGLSRAGEPRVEGEQAVTEATQATDHPEAVQPNDGPPTAPTTSPASTGPDGAELSRALGDERQRLLRQREQSEAEQSRIHAEIEGVDARIGHIDALLAAEAPDAPPAEWPRIGSRPAKAA